MTVAPSLRQLCALLLVGSLSFPAVAKERKSDVTTAQSGIASWYGGRWIGRKTANGERYGAADMTAAHRNLPFGTMVRVTNLRNQRSTVVRINNRGPYIKGRLIDVSTKAAAALGMVDSGIAKVKVEVVPTTFTPALASAAAERLTLDRAPRLGKTSELRFALMVQPPISFL